MEAQQDIERLAKSEIQRPKLTDPEEFAIIREIYFDNDMIAKPQGMDVDMQEKFDRMQRRQRSKRISSR